MDWETVHCPVCGAEVEFVRFDEEPKRPPPRRRRKEKKR